MHVSKCRYYEFEKRFAAIAASIRLHRALVQKMWDAFPATCRQLPGIGKLLGEKLLEAGFGDIASMVDADPRHIEKVTNKVCCLHHSPSHAMPYVKLEVPNRGTCPMVFSGHFDVYNIDTDSDCTWQVYPWGDQKREDARRLLPPQCQVNVDLSGKLQACTTLT